MPGTGCLGTQTSPPSFATLAIPRVTEASLARAPASLLAGGIESQPRSSDIVQQHLVLSGRLDPAENERRPPGLDWDDFDDLLDPSLDDDRRSRVRS